MCYLIGQHSEELARRIFVKILSLRSRFARSDSFRCQYLPPGKVRNLQLEIVKTVSGAPLDAQIKDLLKFEDSDVNLTSPGYALPGELTTIAPYFLRAYVDAFPVRRQEMIFLTADMI